MATKEVSLRLTPKGEEAVKKALRDIGEDGKKMADKLDKGGKKSTRALKALDGAGKEAAKSVDNLADRAGFAAGPLKAMGGAGVAATAGIGALVLGLGAAIRIGVQAADAFADIGNSAEALGLSAETFQAVTAEAEAMGVASGVLETGMKSLMERQSQLSLGTGELFSRLKDTNQELLRQLEALDNNEDRLRAVTDAMRDAESETERNRIAYAAFGEAGANLSRVLLNTEGGIDGLIEKGKALGLVMDEDLIARGQELSTNMAIAGEVMDLQLKQAFIDFAPVALAATNVMADLAGAAGKMASSFRDAADNSARFNDGRLNVLADRLESFDGVDPQRIIAARNGGRALGRGDIRRRPGASGALTGSSIRSGVLSDLEEFNRVAEVQFARAAENLAENYRRELAGLGVDELTDRLTQVTRELSIHQTNAARNTDPDRAFRIDEAVDSAESRKSIVERLIIEAQAREAGTAAMAEQREETARLASAEADAATAARDLLTLRRQAAAIALELGDATGALAIKQAELDRLVGAGLISQDQANTVLTTYREKLDGTAEAAKRWLLVIEGAQTPLENIQQTIRELNADLASGKFGEAGADAELYTEALRELTEALGLATQAEAESTDVYKAAEQVREGLKKSREAALSDSDLLQREESRLNELVTQGALQRNEATAALELYSQKLREARGEVGSLARAETLLDGIESGRIRTIDDLKSAILAMIVSVVRQAAMAQAQAGAGGGLGGFLAGVFGNIAGSFGGSSSTNPSGVPSIFGPGTVQQAHSGGVIGNSPREMRQLGMGLGRDERMVVGRVGEEIVTAGERKAIIEFIQDTSVQNMQPGAMLAGPLPLDIRLSVRSEGGNAEVEAAPSADGNGLDISVVMRDQVRREAASGGLDDALEGRGFVRQTLV